VQWGRFAEEWMRLERMTAAKAKIMAQKEDKKVGTC